MILNTPSAMPRKIRQALSDLRRAGFVPVRKTSGSSHHKFKHPRGVIAVLAYHKPGADMKDYQEEDVRIAIEESKK